MSMILGFYATDKCYPWGLALDCIAFCFPRELCDIQKPHELRHEYVCLWRKVWTQNEIKASFTLKIPKRKLGLCSEFLPRLWNSSWNFICINCIPAFVEWRVCFSSYRISLSISKLDLYIFFKNKIMRLEWYCSKIPEDLSVVVQTTVAVSEMAFLIPHHGYHLDCSTPLLLSVLKPFPPS